MSIIIIIIIIIIVVVVVVVAVIIIIIIVIIIIGIYHFFPSITVLHLKEVCPVGFHSKVTCVIFEAQALKKCGLFFFLLL